MMRKAASVACTILAATLTAEARAAAQARSADPIEIPLRVESGRLLVTAESPDGRTFDFVLGVGMALLTESGSTRLSDARGSLTIGGVAVEIEDAQTVPDTYLSGSDAVGVLGGKTLNRYDVLIDAPNGRLVLKPAARAVRWGGIALSGPVRLQVFHDVLLRADVEFGGELVGGLIDLARPEHQVGDALASKVADGAVGTFRVGYGSWSDAPAVVVDNRVFGGWDPDGAGFVFVGASLAHDCAIAISWYHAELRTCTR
jgi:hypothetical protein